MAQERVMMVRMSEQQHKAVRVKAAEQGRHISVVVRELLHKWTEEREPDESTDKRT